MAGKRRDVAFSRTPPTKKKSKVNRGRPERPSHSNLTQKLQNEKPSRLRNKKSGSGFTEGQKESREGEEEQEEEEADVLTLLDEETPAYIALLNSLHSKGGSFADTYARRQREEQGASSSDEDNPGKLEEEDEDGVDARQHDGTIQTYKRLYQKFFRMSRSFQGFSDTALPV